MNKNRYCIKANSDNVDDVLAGLRKLGAHVVSASCRKDDFLILYYADKDYSLDEVLHILSKDN